MASTPKPIRKVIKKEEAKIRGARAGHSKITVARHKERLRERKKNKDDMKTHIKRVLKKYPKNEEGYGI